MKLTHGASWFNPILESPLLQDSVKLATVTEALKSCSKKTNKKKFVTELCSAMLKNAYKAPRK